MSDQELIQAFERTWRWLDDIEKKVDALLARTRRGAEIGARR